MSKRAFAIASHPDDIEFGMVGTLLKLKDAGYEVHYMNIATGSMGTNCYTHDEIVAIRRNEAKTSAESQGIIFHESICDDLEVFYCKELFRQLVPVVREVDPEIILTHGPYDYMEDHVNAGRLAVSAAFCRGMTNCPVTRPAKAVDTPVAVYHSMPHSITDALRRPVIPGMFVNVGDKIETKKAMLGCHKSQKEWLDVSQGMDAYLDEMVWRMEYFGKLSGRYKYAEGWIRHNATGFCAPDFNPLLDALKSDAFVNPAFEASLKVEFPA